MTEKQFLELQKEYGFEGALIELAKEHNNPIIDIDDLLNYVKQCIDDDYYSIAINYLEALKKDRSYKYKSIDDGWSNYWILNDNNPTPIKNINDIKEFFEKEGNEI